MNAYFLVYLTVLLLFTLLWLLSSLEFATYFMISLILIVCIVAVVLMELSASSVVRKEFPNLAGSGQSVVASELEEKSSPRRRSTRKKSSKCLNSTKEFGSVKKQKDQKPFYKNIQDSQSIWKPSFSQFASKLFSFKSSPVSNSFSMQHPHDKRHNVLSAAGPLLSAPILPKVKRALGLNDSYTSPGKMGLTSPLMYRAFPSSPSPGVLPTVRLGRRSRLSLSEGNTSMIHSPNTVKIAPSKTYTVASPRLVKLHDSKITSPERKTPDTLAVVTALKERRKRTIGGGHDESMSEAPIQQSKRRRQESQQSNASTSSLPPLPDQLPDLSLQGYNIRISTPGLKRSAAQNDLADQWEGMAIAKKPRTDSRNNSILSSLSSSKRVADKLENTIHLKRRALHQDKENWERFPQHSKVDDGDISMLDGSISKDISFSSSVIEPASSAHKETSASRTSTPNTRPRSQTPSRGDAQKSMLDENFPTKRSQMSIYSGLGAGLKKVPQANVLASLEDYELDRTTEQNRIEQMLNDISSEQKQKEKNASQTERPSVSTTQSTSSSLGTTSVGATTTAFSINTTVPAASSTTTSVSPLVQVTLATGTTTSSSSLPGTGVAGQNNSAVNQTPVSTAAAPSSTSGQQQFTFKPIFGTVTSPSSTPHQGDQIGVSANGSPIAAATSTPCPTPTSDVAPVLSLPSATVAPSVLPVVTCASIVNQSASTIAAPGSNFSFGGSALGSVAAAPFNTATSVNSQSAQVSFGQTSSSVGSVAAPSGTSGLFGTGTSQFSSLSPAAVTPAGAPNVTSSAIPGISPFTFGSAATSPSQSTTTKSVFGANQPISSTSSASKGLNFGTGFSFTASGAPSQPSTLPTSVFGMPSNTTTSNVSSGFTATTPTPSAFGSVTSTTPASSTNQKTPVFGAITNAGNASAGFNFGTMASAPPGSGMGTGAPSGVSLFGAPASTQPQSSSTFQFGKPTSTQPASTAPPISTQSSIFSLSANNSSTTTFGASSGATPAPSFGIGSASQSTSSSVFGSGTVSASQTPVFGSGTQKVPSSTPVFGGSQTTKQSSVFGNPPTDQKSVFGQNQTGQTSAFGGQMAVFGQTSNQPSVFGGSGSTNKPDQKPVFGQTPSSTGAVFGSSSQNQTGFAFGVSPPTVNGSSAANPTAAFGQGGTGTFGTPTTQTGSGGMFAFGQTSTQQAPAASGTTKGFDFGASAAGTAQFGFGNSGSSFGTPSATPAVAFGTQSATPAVAFGTQSATPAMAFGTPSATSTPAMFTIGAQSTAPKPRAMSKAKRRTQKR